MRICLCAPYPRYDSLEQFCSNFWEVKRFRVPDELLWVFDFNPSYLFFPHWHWKVPKEIYETYECVMFHATDLPYGRGGSPIRNLKRLGKEDTVLTAFKCVEEMDAGSVYMKRPLSLEGSEDEILVRAAHEMENMIFSIVTNCIQPQPQEGEPTYFRRIV